MLEIKCVDGIPCITVDEGMFLSFKDLREESKKLIMPEYFTEIQESKESSYYNKVLDEIKRKFGEK